MKGINVRLENQDFTKSSKSFLQDLKSSVELPRLNGVFEKWQALHGCDVFSTTTC